MSSITFQGLDQLQRKFNALPDRMQRKYLRQGMTRAATIIKQAIRPLVPQSRKTGTRNKWSRKVRQQRAGVKDALRGSLYGRPSSSWPSAGRQARRGIIAIAVGHRWNRGAHDHLVEFGTRRKQWWGRPASRQDRGQHYFQRGWNRVKHRVMSEIQNKVRQSLK